MTGQVQSTSTTPTTPPDATRRHPRHPTPPDAKAVAKAQKAYAKATRPW